MNIISKGKRQKAKGKRQKCGRGLPTLICSLLLAVCYLLLATRVFAEVPPNSPTDGAGTYITWDCFSSSGSERHARITRNDTVFAFVRHTIDGGGAPVFAMSGTDTICWVRRGERYIDYDVRKPFSWIDPLDTISYSPQWLVYWGGIDTTLEDGEGWGLRGYTVQYAIGSPDSTWYNWFTNVGFTMAIFGPSSPVVVQDSVKYYFRVRTEDRNTNIEDEHYYDQWVQYFQPNLSFSVNNLEGGNDWTVDETLGIAEDSVVAPTYQDVFIIKNLSILDSIDMAIRSFPYAIPLYMNWTLADEPDTNIFALRAIFNDNGTPPTIADFNSDNNIVRDTFITADAVRFGPKGYHILPVWMDSLSRTDNLWLEMQLPPWSFAYGETTAVQLILQLKAISVTP